MSDQVEVLARKLLATVDGPHGPTGDAGQRLAHYRQVAEAVVAELGRDRERLVEVAQEIIAQWVETAYRITLCGEPELHPGAERMRHLHLAEPWLPACKIANAVSAWSAVDSAGEGNWCTCRCEGCLYSGHCAVNYTGCHAGE